MRRAQDLQDIAYATEGRNRQYLSKGFNDTIDYVKGNLEKAAGDYYNIEVQPTAFQVPSEDLPFTVDGVTYTAVGFDSDIGVLTGSWTDTPMVVAANVGCAAVSQWQH